MWSARENAIYWVDISKPALHRYSLATANVTTWSMPERIGWVIERADKPGFIAGFQSGFYELTLNPVQRSRIADPEPHLPDNRMNDAKVDCFGRIWAGTMDCEIRFPTGSLYSLDAGWNIIRRDTGYMIANGPAFGANHECMYHNDTGRSVVYRFELLPDGELGQRTEFLRLASEDGTPDGMTVDTEGGLWLAQWGAHRVCRYTSDGVLDVTIDLPASQITSCVFGGENLDRLFITSAAIDRPDEPLAGALFEVDPQGFKGIPPHLFAG